MGEKTIELLIIVLAFLIFRLLISFKFKDFIPEIYNKMFFVVIYFMIIGRAIADNGFTNEIFHSFYIFLFLAVVIVAITIVKKDKIYYFKEIDNKFIKVKSNEITQILQDYKNNNLKDEAMISLNKDRIVLIS